LIIFSFSKAEKVRNNKKQTGISNSGNSFDKLFKVLSKSIVQVMESNIKTYKTIGKIRFKSNFIFCFLNEIKVTTNRKTRAILLIA
jgi:hypothetical protein